DAARAEELVDLGDAPPRELLGVGDAAEAEGPLQRLDEELHGPAMGVPGAGGRQRLVVGLRRGLAARTGEHLAGVGLAAVGAQPKLTGGPRVGPPGLVDAAEDELL